jgi:hypothetical protein
VEIRDLENKGALDGSQECLVFYVCGQGISIFAKIQATGRESSEKWKSSREQVLRRLCNLQ